MRDYYCYVIVLLVSTFVSAAATSNNLPQISPGSPFAFAVLGDNRGGDDGLQPESFRQILNAINSVKPDFVLNTGDMIYGRTEDEKVAREMWRHYRETIAQLQMPMFHAVGNHDSWNEMSSRLYREIWGPTYYTFEYGGVRFISLDTETLPGRLGEEQLAWLKSQLDQVQEKLVFIFLHRPLFPVDGAIGSSLDEFPAERDRLHRLFVEYKERIRGVFLGHEHLYNFSVRDGVAYYITGGGGANLYLPPELGGFHHYLLVQVKGTNVHVECKKVGASRRPLLAPAKVAPGTTLESWEQGLFWYAWDYTAGIEIASGDTTEGKRGLQLSFDLGQHAWPVLVLPLPNPWDTRKTKAFAIDVFVPPGSNAGYSVTPALEGKQKRKAPPIRLNPGWNVVKMDLEQPWLPKEERGSVRGFEWGLSVENASGRGSVIFDNFRAERSSFFGGSSSEVLEGWERPLLWRVADESVGAVISPEYATTGKKGVQLQLDFSQCPRPVMFARLNPPWSLSNVPALAADIYVPSEIPAGLSVHLSLRSGEADYAAPPVSLQKGWNKVSVRLSDQWLPRAIRDSTELVQWALLSTNKLLRGPIVFDNFRAEKQ